MSDIIEVKKMMCEEELNGKQLIYDKEWVKTFEVY